MLERERWAKVDRLFDGALDRPPEERAGWLREACEGDEALCREVLRLVEASQRGAGELEPRPELAGEALEELLPEDDGTEQLSGRLPPGHLLGPYRIVGLIGRGGMGWVYEAEDPRLGRRVALKLLPPELDTPERRLRFEREARAIAALSHPGIVHVYSVEEADGIHFITMERVSGRTLRDLIDPDGLPLPRLLGIAIPLADALAAAHAGGVIHRDVKPSNVMIGEDGHVKVLDFGLAKWETGPPPAPGGRSFETREGHVLGTVSHMSPEQAEDRPVDARSDLFALGVTLFEMSTGVLPFRGESAASILTAIIRDTPPSVTDLNPRMPAELARIVKHCLAKEPERRYQTALDVRNDLEEVRSSLATGELGARKRRAARLPLLAAGLAVLALLASLLWRRPARTLPEPVEGTFAAVTSAPGPELFPSLSADGRFLAYCGRGEGRWDVYLQRVEGQRPINLTGDSGADNVQPSFSPDSESIAFHSSRSGGGLFLMGATGESVRRLADFGWNPSFSPDGKLVVVATKPVFDTPLDRPTRSELWVASVDGGAPRRVSAGDAVQPAWSPHGQRIAYWGLVEGGSRRDLWTIPAAGGPAVPVTQDEAVDWSPAWAPAGDYLYFSSDRGGSMNLWRVAIDEASGRVLGEPERVTTPAAFAHHASFSRDGRRLAYVSSDLSEELERVGFDAASGRPRGEPEPVAPDLRRKSFPNVSPDGRWLVYDRTDPQEDLVLGRVDGSETTTLTDDPFRDRRPRFSPDGRRIAFYSDRGGHYEVWVMERDGTNLRQLSHDPGRRNARYPSWSPDGSRLLFGREGVTGQIVAASGGPDAPVLRELPAYAAQGDWFMAFSWSPDGRFVSGYLMTPEGQAGGIAVFDLERNEYARLTEFGQLPEWLPDSRRLVFQERSPASHSALEFPGDEGLFLVDRVTRKLEPVLAVPGTSLGYPTVSPDGRWLFFVRSVQKADIWLLSMPRPPS